MTALTALNLILRPEGAQDFRKVEELTRDAFWNVNEPGCNEHYLAHILRDSPDFIAELDYVAELDGIPVGNIMYARSVIRISESSLFQVLTFGPVSVLPALQGKGIGSALITHTLELAQRLGHTAVVIYGDPAYYGRFGFKAGESFGICTRDGWFNPALQALELVPSALTGISGSFIEANVYNLDNQAADQFDTSFPPRSKAVTPSQSRYLELLSQSHR